MVDDKSKLSIQEQLLLQNHTITIEFNMNEFEWNIVKPNVNDIKYTLNGFKVIVKEVMYYKSSCLGIIRLGLVQ